MAIFYLLHNIEWGSELSSGARNARTFLVGSVVYALLYTIVAHWIRTQSDLYESLRLFVTMVFIADLFTMGYTYRNHYGRTILNELGDNDSEWEYNAKRDRYRKKKAGPVRFDRSDLSQTDDAEVLLSRQIRAAVKIQRWWRRIKSD